MNISLNCDKLIVGDESMKKLLTFLTLLTSLALTGCTNDGVTPVAYTRFISTGTQYVFYTSYVYATTNGHIQVWKDFEESERQFGSMDIMFTFSKCDGADDLDGNRYILVDLSDKTVDFTVDILKSSDIFDVNKKIYLNGEALTPSQTDGADSESDPLYILTFTDITFIRTNTGGKLDGTKVNTLEYK